MKTQKLLFLLPVLLLAGCAGAYDHDLTDYLYKDSNGNEGIVVDSATGFKILVLSDLHFSNSEDCEKQFGIINKTIEQAQPNYIVLNGDSFTFADKSTAKRLFNFINEASIRHNAHWSYTYGNHDDQGLFNANYLQRLAPTYSNCAFVNVENDKISGRSNYCVNLINSSGTILHQLYFLDSLSYRYLDYWGYDFIKPEQIKWYEDMVEMSNKKNNPNYKIGDEAIPSSMFFHIALPEIMEAEEEYQKMSPEEQALNGYGKFDTNDYGAPKHNSGLFDKIVKLKSTKTVTWCHDHDNALYRLYQGVKLVYGLKSTDRIYYTKNKLGGTLQTIQEDGSSEITYIYSTYENSKEGGK